MSVVHESSASCADVWSVLSDGWFFASWVVGASRIRAVEPDWPAVGSRIHHSVGVWPALIDDTTEVLESVPERELKLLARVFPVGQAAITLRLHPAGSGCRIEIIELAASAPLNLAPEWLQEIVIRPRNVEALRRLALIAEHSSRPR